MKTLLAFSGGLDSTYLLWELLTKTNDEVTTVFLDESFTTDPNSFGGQYNFSPYERIQTEKIIAWLNTTGYRSFNHVVQVVDNFLADENTPIRIVRDNAAALNSSTYDRIAFGYLYDEVLPDHTQIDHPGRLTNWAINRAFAASVTAGSIYMPYLTAPGKGKMHAISELPVELFNLTLSCSTPVVNADGSLSNCANATCRKCSWISFLKSKLDSGMTADQVMAWVLNERVKTGSFRRGREISLGYTFPPSYGNGYLEKFADSGIWKRTA